jgi:hypothetical protein
MALYYPIYNATNFVGLLQWTNSLTSYYFGPLVVLALFATLFLAMKRYGTEQAFASSAFISAIACFLLFLIDLTTVQHVVLCGVAVLVSVFALKFSEGGI